MEVTRYSMFEVSAASTLMTIGYELAQRELTQLAAQHTPKEKA